MGGFDDIVALLLDDRLNNPICNINFCKVSNGQSPLFVACDRGYIKIVAQLLAYKRMKCDINMTDSHNRTPLMRACTKSHDEIVKLLLKNGADINILSEYGQSCLLSAFRINKAKICKILYYSMMTMREILSCGDMMIGINMCSIIRVQKVIRRLYSINLHWKSLIKICQD